MEKFLICLLSLSIQFAHAKCKNCTRKQDVNSPQTKNYTLRDSSTLGETSKKIAALEKEWKNLDLKISHLSRQSASISGEINSQNNAISQNMAKMISGSSNHENVVISSCNHIANDRFKKLTNKCQELKKVREEIKSLKQLQSEVLSKLETEKISLKDKSTSTLTKDKLVNDTIFDIAKQATDIPDLLARIDLEISAGAFRQFVKCEAPSPHIYPVETLLIEKKVFQSNDKRFKFIDIDISCRPGSFVFSPIFGTVVFYDKLSKYGNTVVIKNSNAYAVITGVYDTHFAVGKVVKKGQIIGALQSTEYPYSNTKYVIRVKSKKK